MTWLWQLSKSLLMSDTVLRPPTPWNCLGTLCPGLSGLLQQGTTVSKFNHTTCASLGLEGVPDTLTQSCRLGILPNMLDFVFTTPVCTRHLLLTSSTRETAAVAPHSGHMLATVDWSAMNNWATPGPENSTNLPTTPTWLRCWPGIKTMSVDVSRGRDFPNCSSFQGAPCSLEDPALQLLPFHLHPNREHSNHGAWYRVSPRPPDHLGTNTPPA